jgi:Na+/melibiose symporter-like transporter
MAASTDHKDTDKWAAARIPEWAGKGAAAAAAATSAVRPFFLAGFGAGVVLNDACASCWFNFLFVFLERVQGLSGAQVGAVFLAGQLSDAVATPLIGYLADRAQGLHLFGLGRRQLFYLLGATIVSLSFVFVFAVCLPVRWLAGWLWLA